MTGDAPWIGRRVASSWRLRGMLLAALAFAVASFAAPPATAAGLTTGIMDPLDHAFGERDGIASYHYAYGTGVRIVRIPLTWDRVASTAPRDATDPDDPAYDWTYVDDKVKRIVANRLAPLVSVYSAPAWARRPGTQRTPNVEDFGAFMSAVARRYDGRRHHRVRFFQAWNEPNLWSFLDPDPATYRALVHRADRAVHAVHRDNKLIAGGLGPFGGRYGMAPKRFMRRLFARPVPFDIWSHHPYTSGGPTHKAYRRDDASIGDLPELRRMLVNAKRAGRIRSTRFWVTEFSWDTKPPDPGGVPAREHARWVAEALYRMWRSGIDTVVWFQLRDNPRGPFEWGQTFQSGLFYRTTALYKDERPKPAARAFRFPFVAFPSRRGVRIWGRTPDSRSHPVAIEQRVGRRWRRLARFHADRDGMFDRVIRTRSRRPLRALSYGDRSHGFAPRRTRDRRVNPFGDVDGSSLNEDR